MLSRPPKYAKKVVGAYYFKLRRSLPSSLRPQSPVDPPAIFELTPCHASDFGKEVHKGAHGALTLGSRGEIAVRLQLRRMRFNHFICSSHGGPFISPLVLFFSGRSAHFPSFSPPSSNPLPPTFSAACEGDSTASRIVLRKSVACIAVAHAPACDWVYALHACQPWHHCLHEEHFDATQFHVAIIAGAIKRARSYPVSVCVLTSCERLERRVQSLCADCL